MPSSSARVPGNEALRRLRECLAGSVQAAWEGLRAPAFLLLLLVTLGSWLAAYQAKTTYTVEVGGLHDDAYVSGFHAKEQTPQLAYRWSTGHATIKLPGIGNEPVQLSLTATGSRPNLPPPAITLAVRGMTFHVQTAPELHTYTFFVPRGNRWDGDLSVELDAPTFNEGPPDNPGRALGVTVTRLTVAPASFGLRPIVVPPLPTIAGLLAGLVLLCLSLVVAVRQRAPMLLLGAILAATATLLVVVARPELGLLAPEMPGLGLLCLLMAVAGRALLDVLLDDGSRAARWVVGWGTAAFVLAFALRFGGLIYPQFRTSDLELNVHNVQAVMGGDWVFTEPLPDGTPGPYPPALYVPVIVLSSVFGHSEASLARLIEGVTAALDAATCLALAGAAYRLWRGRHGAWAALTYAVLPASFELFSAGNYANLFAQGTLNLAMLGGLVFLNLRQADNVRAWRLLLFVTVCFSLTMLGHYGMMLGTLAIGGVFAVWVVLQTLRGKWPMLGWRLLGSLALSLLLAFALYYRNLLDVIWNHISGVVGKLGHTQGTISGGTAGGPAQTTGRAGLFEKLGGKVSRLLGVEALILGTGGLLRVGLLRPGAGAWLGSWLLVTLLFALLDQALGDAIRWYYLGAAAIALLGGRFLGLVARRGRVALLFSALAICAMLLQLLQTWVGDLIFTRYHSP